MIGPGRHREHRTSEDHAITTHRPSKTITLPLHSEPNILEPKTIGLFEQKTAKLAK